MVPSPLRLFIVGSNPTLAAIEFCLAIRPSLKDRMLSQVAELVRRLG